MNKHQSSMDANFSDGSQKLVHDRLANIEFRRDKIFTRQYLKLALVSSNLDARDRSNFIGSRKFLCDSCLRIGVSCL